MQNSSSSARVREMTRAGKCRPLHAADDPTLRPGDIVATNAGLMAYNAGPNGSSLVPISTYAGLSADLRRQLTEVKIAPAA